MFYVFLSPCYWLDGDCSILFTFFFSVLFLFLLVMQIDKLHANIFQQQKLKNVSAANMLVLS